MSGRAGRETRLPPAGSAIHLVGIGGAGMRGLAVLLAERGYRVSGCDGAGVPDPEMLLRRGIRLHEGHDPAHVAEAGALVYSSAVPLEAPELVAAREAGLPILKRASALGALMRGRRLVGVAGTHGKTTITAMTGLACEAAGLDPTVAVGGRVSRWDGYARPGGAEIAIVEADEYDRSFLHLDPSLAVVSSLEPEHLDTYGSFEALQEAFAEFAGTALARDGLLYCADDPGARGLARRLGAGDGYGFSEAGRYRVDRLGSVQDGGRCRLRAPEGEVEFRLAVPGDHNLRNATAAMAVALRLGADAALLGESLASFRGVDRRLQMLGEREGLVLVDDYAHHPTELRASIEALRDRYPEHRLVVVFQPHLFSRTRAFAAEFAAGLSEADEALVLPIYPAREAPLPGVTSALITAGGAPEVREAGRDDAREAALASPGVPTVIAFMGAGDVTELAHAVARDLGFDAVGD